MAIENNRDAFQAEIFQFQRAYNERILAELERQTKKIEHLESTLSSKLATDAEIKEKLITLTIRVDKHDELFEKIEGRLLSVDDVRDYKKVKSIGIGVLVIFGALQAIQMIPDLIRLFAKP